MIGMHIGDPSTNIWLTPANYTLLVIDLATGIILFSLTFKQEGVIIYIIFVLLSIIILSHLWRDIDYFTNTDTRFCFNVGLMIFNYAKLLLAIASLVVGIIWKTKG
jgi:hypothetical protein